MPDPVANSSLPAELLELYAPLLVEPDPILVVAHLAQSLDGCVALHTGESQWISGQEDILHTHRLRALVDAVVVGVQTVLDDDPQLNVRLCEGQDPVRVVLDPRGRAHRGLRVFREGPPTWRFCARAEREHDVVLPVHDGLFAPADVLAALAERGIRRVLVEGGGVTVSHFLAAGCVNRLHLVVAPVLLGGGRRAFPSPLVQELAAARRMPARPIPLGSDWLFDCELR
ncbi:MAG: RibD family protein [Myxococcales bacterium]|nr:RibD family protein [Myxococcales bacterium]